MLSLASDGSSEGEAGSEVGDEVLASLMAGSGQAGENLPGAFASLGLVATGELAGDHGWGSVTDSAGKRGSICVIPAKAGIQSFPFNVTYGFLLEFTRRGGRE